MRLEISRRADLATRALVALATSGERTKGAALADQLEASAGFLAQAMTPLVHAGWVRSEPGPTGGYVLVGDPAAISVLQVIEAVEGRTDTTGCVLEDRACGAASPCALHVPWSAARTTLLDQLDQASLADLVGR